VDDVLDVDELEAGVDADDVVVDVDPPEGVDPPDAEESAVLAEPSADPLDEEESEPDLRESLR